jgi:hypothetical protein
MGKADAQARGGQIDAAIASWKEAGRATGRRSAGRCAARRTGPRATAPRATAAEARKTFQQVVDQHPNSPYAPVARTELDGLTAS